MKEEKTSDTNDAMLMQELDNVDDLTKKLVNDLNRLCDELDRQEEKYKARQREWFCVGFFFLILTVTYFVLVMVLDKPDVLIWVALQFFSSVTLIINNIGGFRHS